MANSLGTLATAVILQQALDLVFTERPDLRMIALNTTDLDGNASRVRKDQQVITRTRAIPAVQDFGAAASDRADVDVPVTLNKFKQILYTFTASEINSTDRDLVRESAEPVATAIANHLIDAAAANWLNANFPLKTTKGAGWDYTHLVAVRKVLQQRGVPKSKRFYAANSEVYASMLNDPLIVAAFNNPANAEAIKNGQLPMVAGLMIAEYPDLPALGENLVAFAGATDSVIVATRAPQNPEELLPNAKFPGALGYVQDAKSGFQIMVNEWIGVDLSVNIRMVFLYGTAKGNANNGQRIVSA